MRAFVVFLVALLATPLWAQDDSLLNDLLQDLNAAPQTFTPAPEVDPEPQAAEITQAAELRFLDRMTGRLESHVVQANTPFEWRDLSVTLGECRYPAENIAGDAYAYLDIRALQEGNQAFAGWMIASSPALMAMDHARYDVWVLRCITS